MFWSKYNILSKSNKYGYLLFNTMSLAFIRILENDINTWLELKENPDSYKDFYNSNFLLKARIIVENQEDDLNVYLADILKNRYNSSDMALTILPTRGCNFGCIYCYEQDRPNIAMSEQTEDAIVRFVKSNSNLKRLSVVWYGGEPLLNFDSIVRLTKKFQQLGIEYSIDSELNEMIKKTKNTVLIVGQRIASIMNAQQIIVLDEGKIVGKGTHEELMNTCEVYQEIAYSQLSKEELGHE